MKTEEEKKAILCTLHVNDIPLALRQHFKAKCDILGLTMRQAVISLMKEFVKR